MKPYNAQLNAEAALGRFVIAFSELETAVRKLIALKYYYHLDDFMILVEHISLLSLIDGYKRAFSCSKKLIKLFDGFRDINGQRNKIVHAEWKVDFPTLSSALSASGVVTSRRSEQTKYIPEHVVLDEDYFYGLIEKCSKLKFDFELLITEELKKLRLLAGDKASKQ